MHHFDTLLHALVPLFVFCTTSIPYGGANCVLFLCLVQKCIKRVYHFERRVLNFMKSGRLGQRCAQTWDKGVYYLNNYAPIRTKVCTKESLQINIFKKMVHFIEFFSWCISEAVYKKCTTSLFNGTKACSNEKSETLRKLDIARDFIVYERHESGVFSCRCL